MRRQAISKGHDSARYSAAEAWAQDVLAKMTLAEKIGQLNQVSEDSASAVLMDAVAAGRVGSVLNVVDPSEIAVLQAAASESRLGIPLLVGRDVVHGFEVMAPIPLGLAATWNPAKVEKFCTLTAAAARSRGINWTFAPMLDVCRDPRWGRIAEGFGEDARLTSVMAEAFVRGLQASPKDSLLACPKHFAGYGASESGLDYNRTYISDIELFNVYFPPFAAAFDAGAITVMPSFSDVNGQPGAGNRRLLTTLLRDRLGFRGVVVSDWAALAELPVHGVAEDGKEAAQLGLNAGVHIDMMSGLYERFVPELVDEGPENLEQLDALVLEILIVKHLAGLLEPNATKSAEPVIDDLLHSATELASESCILLTNEGGTLPITNRNDSLAVIGPLSDQREEQLGTWSFDADPQLSVSILKALKARWQGSLMYSVGLSHSRGMDGGGIEEASSIAAKATQTVLVLGEEAILSGEAHCRSRLDLPGDQLRLLDAVADAAEKLIVVILAGRPLELADVVERADAVLFCFHPGSGTGPAVADLLLGDANPSGRLPVTLPRRVGQVPIYYGRGNTGRPPLKGEVQFLDDIPVGAKQYSTGNTSYHLDVDPSPLFPFGFGKSYTDFRYDRLTVSVAGAGRTLTISIEVRVTNVGDRSGLETVQLYLRDPVARVARPVRELKVFEKVMLAPEESRRIEFKLGIQDLAYHDGQSWFVEPGRFEWFVGSDSTARLSHPIDLDASQIGDEPLGELATSY